MGFTSQDLKTMSLSRLVFMAGVYGSANGKSNEEQGKPREATQADIAAFFL